MPVNKAVFLDRDGVINELVYHREQEVIDSPFTVKQFKLIPGVTDAIKLLQQNRYLVVIVSNQPGIAKGHMTSSVFTAICEKMKNELSSAGIKLDGEYYCLHHPESKISKFKVKCNCRKPEPGLFQKGKDDLDIDLKNSWLVGNTKGKFFSSLKAHIRTVIVCLDIPEL